MTCDQCNGVGSTSVTAWPATRYKCEKCMGTGIMGNHMFYAGIGSRETPDAICSQMTLLAGMFASKGIVLRSGRGKKPVKAKPGTDSADLAFERGCDYVNGQKVIRTATALPKAIEHAAQFHPAWDKCDEYMRALHGRNSLIMLGDDLAQPVSLVACYTANGQAIGGTGQAIRIAEAMAIPVYNLFYPQHYDALMNWLGSF